MPESRGFGGGRMAGREIGVLPCDERLAKQEQGRSGRAAQKLYDLRIFGKGTDVGRDALETVRLCKTLQAGRPRRWVELTTRPPSEPRREAHESKPTRTPAVDSRHGTRANPRRRFTTRNLCETRRCTRNSEAGG